VGAELFHADERTDGQTNMTKLTVAKSRVFIGSILRVTWSGFMKVNEKSVMYDMRS
jgi:hypothetical protein